MSLQTTSCEPDADVTAPLQTRGENLTFSCSFKVVFTFVLIHGLVSSHFTHDLAGLANVLSCLFKLLVITGSCVYTCATKVL